MKHIILPLLVLLLAIPTSLLAQRDIPATDHMDISGAVKSAVTLTIPDILSFPSTALPDVPVYNHMGEVKDTLRELQGVPVKQLFQNVSFAIEKPRELNEFYFVFEASDGYRVVFSWNEIFNTPVGEQLYILTSANGVTLPAMPQRIASLSTGDLQSGRRYVKGLKAIHVLRL